MDTQKENDDCNTCKELEGGTTLIIDDTSIYEYDMDCVKQKQKQKQKEL